MAVSRFATENDLGRAMTHLAQRWAGSSTPVSMMRVGDLRLLLLGQIQSKLKVAISLVFVA